jgi:hypothetical protein
MQKCSGNLLRSGPGLSLEGFEIGDGALAQLKDVHTRWQSGIYQRLMVIKNGCVDCTTLTIGRLL